MKHLNTYITEYIIKKKLDTPIDSEDHYEYYPKTKDELIHNIKELIKQDIYDFNCIDTSEITDMSYLFDDLENISIKENFDVSEWDVSNVTNMSHMFNKCIKFENSYLKEMNNIIINYADSTADTGEFDEFMQSKVGQDYFELNEELYGKK